MTSFASRFISYDHAISDLKDQCRTRPIVPFLGAGISLASGFPAISAVIEYLSKVDFAIQQDVYAHRYPDVLISKTGVAREYHEHPSRFLRDFGWPRLGQIDADLWEWLDREVKKTTCLSDDPSFLQAVGKIPFRLIDKNYAPSGLGMEKLKNADAPILIEQEQYRQRLIEARIQSESSRRELHDLLSRDICSSFYTVRSRFEGTKLSELIVNQASASDAKGVVTLDLRDRLRAIAQWGLRKDLRLRETGTSKAALREWLNWKNWYAARERAPEIQPELLYGDWESLLDRLCEGDFDLVDTLFTSLEEGRSPTTTHRFLTFLRTAVDLPLVLTTNFDSLLERAFREAGLNTKVFDIHRDAELPDAELVKRGFSLLKLHGSAYGLRLGERLRSPLEHDAQADVLRYLPDNALVVVLGFSGSERRIMQLLQTIATSVTIRDPRRILWLKGPGSISVPLRQLIHECREAVQICEIQDAGAFLQDWYFAYSQGFQTSPVAYSALGGRPIRSTSSIAVQKLGLDDKGNRIKFRKPVQIFVRSMPDERTEPSSCATLAAGDFVAHLSYQYHPIWIDLESHHTVSGVVADLFDNFRTYDPDAPRVSIADSVDGHVAPEVLKKVIDRIGEILGRGRYVIVLDAIESFGRTQMMHHGIPTYELLAKVDTSLHELLVEQFKIRVKALHRFINELLLAIEGVDLAETASLEGADPAKYFRDSYVVLTVDREQARQKVGGSSKFPTLSIMKEIRESISNLKTNHINTTLVSPNILSNPICDFWESPESLPTEDALIQRIASILCIRQFFAEIASREPAVEIKNDRENIAAFLAILSIFRRPRSIPVVRSLTERWLLPEHGFSAIDVRRPYCSVSVLRAHKTVDKLLSNLQKEEYIVRHEGGRIRLDRSVHEKYYRSLTSDLHIGAVILDWKERFASNPKERASVVVQGLMAASLHFAAARTMYVDVFLLTHDVQAFYEYLYHRVAVLKILTVVTAVMHMPLTTKRYSSCDVGDLVTTEVVSLLSRVELIVADRQKTSVRTATGNSESTSFLAFIRGIGLSGVVDPDCNNLEKFDILAYVQMLRLHALQTLSLAIGRSERLLRSNASPDTLIGWARQFSHREVSDISGEVFVTARKSDPEMFGKGIAVKKVESALRLGAEASTAVASIQSTFAAIIGQSCFAKMDFLSVVEDQLVIRDSGLHTDPALGLIQRSVHLYEKSKEVLKVSISSDELGLSPEKMADDVRSWLMPVRAFSHLGLHSPREDAHLGWHSLCEDVCKWVNQRLLKALKLSSGETAALVKRLQRDFTEFELKHRLGNLCPPWSGLDKGWKFESSIDLNYIERLAVKYETLLRETSRDASEDARHRSSAYVFRARTLYLQGRFRTAHRYLDLASCGGSETVAEQAVGHAAIHLARAELLIYSSHEHLRQFDANDWIFPSQIEFKDQDPKRKWKQCNEIDELAKAGNKIRRAEAEISKASSLLEAARHQTIWSLRVHIGMAQATFERLLLELEQLARSDHVIEGNEFAKISGKMERSVLFGMRNLRSALDHLPYVTESWKEISDSNLKHCISIQDERKIYAMWMHLYVVSRFYWGVLQVWNTNVKRYSIDLNGRINTVEDLITEVNGGRAGHSEFTWQMWCKSLRFGNFADIDLHAWIRRAIDDVRHKSTAPTGRASTDQLPYSVAPLRRSILEICSEISLDDNLENMWNKRRSNEYKVRSDQ